MTDQNKLGVSKRFRYIEDYEMRQVPGRNGKTVRKAVYIGPYLLPGHTDRQYAQYRMSAIAAAVVTVLALAALLLVSEYAVYRQEGLYAIVPAVMCLFPCAYLVMGAFSLPRKNGRMQRDQHMHSVRRVRRSSIGVFVLTALSVLLTVVFVLSVGTPDVGWWDLIYLIALLAPCASSLGCILLQRGIVFTLSSDANPSAKHPDAG